MKPRFATLAVLTAALALPACSSLGLDAFPDEHQVGDGIGTGLDPFPAAQNPEGSAGLGLSPWPDVATGESPGLGLDPFPHDAPEGNDVVVVTDAPPPAGPREGGPPTAPPLNPGTAPERLDGGDRGASGEGSVSIDNDTGAVETVAAKPELPTAEPKPEPKPEPATLRFKFRQDDRWSFRTEMNNTMKSPMFGEAGMQMNMGFDMTNSVGTVADDGGALVTSTVDAIRIKMENPMMGSFAVDSSDPASVEAANQNPMMQQGLGQLLEVVGSEMTLRMNADGTVAETVDGGMLGAMGGMGGMGGGGDPSQMTGSAPFAMPDGPVRAGLSWDIDSEVESPMGTMVNKGKGVVTGWDADSGLATIETDSVIELIKTDPADVDPNDMQAQMMAMMEIRDATSKGTIVFDTNLGRIISMTINTLMTIESPMTGEMSVDSVMVYSPLEAE